MATGCCGGFFIGGVRREQLQSGSLIVGDGADRVPAEEWERFAAEPGHSGELRVGDQAGAVRRAGESSEVQERAGDLSERVRGDCGGEVGRSKSPPLRLRSGRALSHRTRQRWGTPVHGNLEAIGGRLMAFVGIENRRGRRAW
jgi:hypothetical protein